MFAPWVQDLGLSIGSIECAPPPGAPADWQPGAMLRMGFCEHLCRRTMSFGRVTLSSATDNKPVAMVSSAFAML